MALESATYISDLVTTNPTGSDGRNTADDHLRLLKSTIKATFPNISGAVTPTHTELNYVDGVTSAIQTQLDAKGDVTLTGVQTLTNKSLTSPTLTGTPTAPTAAGGTNTTQIATTAFVTAAVSGGGGMTYPGSGIAVSTGSAWTTSKSSPSGDIVGTTDTQTLTNKTLTAPALGTPASGNLSNCTADGTNSVGFLNIPQQIKGSAYTLVLGDAGKHIYRPTSDTTARTWTIPANSSVAYPVGTAITFVNDGGSADVAISITTDTLVYSPSGSTGSRTLARYGVATAIKVTSTRWVISGSGLS